MPEDLKKFSKGSPIQDEHFAEARELWAAWDSYRQGEGPRPEPSTGRSGTCPNSWIVAVDEIKERGYDLTARNPSRAETETYRHPAEITVSLLEKERQIVGIIEDLHDMVGEQNDDAI